MHTIPEPFHDLLGTEFATLATIGPTGTPQQSVVWFLGSDGTVAISLNSARQKTMNLARNPRCSVVITDPASPYRYIEIRGKAVITPDPDYSFADQVGEKYSSDLRQHDGPGEHRVKVVIEAERVRAVNMAG
jgi:PPOX class probable F420-dependent enzyme